MTYEIKWTIEEIKRGFEAFLEAHRRYPTALDIDQYELLPSSRQIQRRFGGLIQLRTILGLPQDFLDFTRGNIRSTVSKKISARGIDVEKLIYDLLISRFGEICVHEQKPFGYYKNKSRLDFLVYCKNFKFGVDVFFANDVHSLGGCINIKEKSYKNIDFDLIFLSANNDIAQTTIDIFIEHKSNILDPYIKILNLENFQNFINKIEPLDILDIKD